MCGISGIFSCIEGKTFPSEWMLRMHSLLKHRGPDGSGVVAWNAQEKYVYAHALHHKKSLPYAPDALLNDARGEWKAAMAHNRLAIVDLGESGHQPMCDATGRYWMVYNGEIYNHPELRKELETKGAVFHSTSDSEVVLQAYIHEGPACVNQFNGMWAFCIYDSAKKTLFASRDRLGVKPFYYVFNKNLFAFASEAKALTYLCKQTGIALDTEEHSLLDYFVFTRIEDGERNWYKNILELKAGKNLMLSLASGKGELSAHYKPMNEETLHHQKHIHWYMDRLEGTFNRAVALRLRSDVEVGACLSGGIDSSLIVASAVMQAKIPLQVFTARFPQKEYDESHYATQVAKKYHCTMHLAEMQAADVQSDLMSLAYCQDFPIWSTSTFLQYRLMKLAAEKGLKVLLDGQGGDELFGGYPHHALFVKGEHSRRSKWFYKTKVALLLLLNRIPGTKNRMALLRKMYPVTEFLNDEWLMQALQGWEAQLPLPLSLNELLVTEASNSLLKLYLRCEDRCSMHYSIESRTPFSDDPDLLSLAFQIPGTMKVHQGMHKYILRKTFKDYLPPEVVIRTDKKGFSTPNKDWIIANEKHWTEEWFSENPGNVLHTEKLKKRYLEYVKSSESGSPHLFKPVAFAAWQKAFS